MSSILKMYPFIFSYKSINLNITEKDNMFIVELNSKHMIHSMYTPQTIKGNKITARVQFNTGERLGSKDNGVSMHITINPDYNWFCSLIENESGVILEIHTGEHQFNLEQSIVPGPNLLHSATRTGSTESTKNANVFVFTAQTNIA